MNVYEQNLGGPYSPVRLVGQLHSAQLSQLPRVPETRRRPLGHTGPRVPLRGRETRGERSRAVFRALRPRTSRDKRDKRGSKISANFAVDWCPALGGASGKLRRTRFACYRRQRTTPKHPALANSRTSSTCGAVILAGDSHLRPSNTSTAIGCAAVCPQRPLSASALRWCYQQRSA